MKQLKNKLATLFFVVIASHSLVAHAVLKSNSYNYLQQPIDTVKPKLEMYKTFYDNGQLKSLGTKNKQGVIEGRVTYYRKDGTLDGKITFNAKGEPEGPFELYFRNGQLQTKSSYSGKGFYENHGPYEDYFSNGQLNSKGTYKNGKQIGNWINYFDNGQLNSKSTFTNTGIIQSNESYYKNGQLRSKTVYNDLGDVIDTLCVYYENGQLFTKTIFDKEGNKKGIYTSYYPNGQLMQTGAYAGIDYFAKKGIWQSFSKDGTLTREIEYDSKGKLLRNTMKTPILPGVWELYWPDNTFFPKGNIQLKRLKKRNDHFVFNTDGTLKQVVVATDVECVVGEFSLHEGFWKLNKDLVTLELKGQVIADYWFWWIIEYKVSIVNNELHLKMKKILKNKTLPPTKTWDDLIKD